MSIDSGFVAGFEKAAAEEEEKKKITPLKASLGVGGAVGGGSVLRDTAKSVRNELAARKLTPQTHAEMMKNLKPGDVLTFRSRQKPSKVMGPIDDKLLMGMGTGSPYSHAGIYLGDGKLMQAKGPNKKSKIERLSNYIQHDEEVRAFRPKDKKSGTRAAAKAKKLTGIPYALDPEDMTDYAKKQIFGGGKAPAKSCNPRTGICYPLVADAYGDKTFKRREIGYNELADKKKFDIVAQSHGAKKYKPQSMFKSDVLGAHVVRPLLRGAAYGGAAAIGTYGLAKALDLVSKSKKKEDKKSSK